MPKTDLKHRLNFALLIAKERNARVVVCLNSYVKVKQAIEYLRPLALELGFSHPASYAGLFVSENGGELRIVDVNLENLHYYGGMRVSHVFVDELDYACQMYMETRIRVPKGITFSSPIGVYLESGAARVMIEY
jgi:hypothetical protein